MNHLTNVEMNSSYDLNHQECINSTQMSSPNSLFFLTRYGKPL